MGKIPVSATEATRYLGRSRECRMHPVTWRAPIERVKCSGAGLLLLIAWAVPTVAAERAPVEIGIGLAERAQRLAIVPGSGQVFVDCPATDACPEITVVPGAPGGAVVGSPETEAARQTDEARHGVTLGAFAIGTREVTVAQYSRCVSEGGCRPPEWLEKDSPHNVETGTSRYYRNLGERLTGPDQPVVGVSHADATAYAGWLAKRTGRGYRLPSEKEWEYSARAGASTAYWWGDEVRHDGRVWANCRGCGSPSDGQGAVATGSLPANPWGLHEVHGNVWEWVADIYCEDYAATPADGLAQTDPECGGRRGKAPPGLRVMRGGSSFFEPALNRAAVRLRNQEDFRNFSVGFRVARSLDP